MRNLATASDYQREGGVGLFLEHVGLACGTPEVAGLGPCTLAPGLLSDL